MKISSKATYVLAYSIVVLLCGIPSSLARVGNNKDQYVNAIDTSDENMDRMLQTICKDDTSWVSTGEFPKTCGGVWINPSRHCVGRHAKVSAGGVSASVACPVACGDFRAVTCDMPTCDDSWNIWVETSGGLESRSCEQYLKSGETYIQGRCRALGEDGSMDEFAYESCNICGTSYNPGKNNNGCA